MLRDELTNPLMESFVDRIYNGISNVFETFMIVILGLNTDDSRTNSIIHNEIDIIDYDYFENDVSNLPYLDDHLTENESSFAFYDTLE